MKKMKRIHAVIATAALLSLSAMSLVGCGGETEVVDIYSANPSSAGTATYLKVPMQMIVSNVEKITVYSDNSYCLSVSTTVITNLKAVTEGNDEVINRGATVLDYYGECQSAEDSGMTILSLKKPTRMTITNTNQLMTGGVAVGYFDTAAWTESDTEAMTTWWTKNQFEGTPSAESILNKFAFSDQEVVVSESGVFDYVKVGFHNIIFGW